MSSAIWINALKEGKVTSNEVDRWAILKFADKLDALCDKLAITKLSDFHDTTDLEANLAPEEEDDEDLPDTYELMAEKGKWFSPRTGIEVMDSLFESLKAKPVRFGLITDHSAEVLTDLEECRLVLQELENEGSMFHLCIVM